MEVFEAFKKEIAETFTDVSPVIDLDRDVKIIENTFYPEVVKILKRDETFFEKERVVMGVDLSQLWKTQKMPVDNFWKNLQMLCVASFMHGDIKEKINPIINALKSYVGMGGDTNDEIAKILNDEKSESHFKEILEYIAQTKIAKIFMEIIEQIDIKELDLNFERPEEVIDIIKNPEHPKIKKIVEKIQNLIKVKVQQGQLTKSRLTEEVEAIKAKVMSIFGRTFNESLGGRGEIPSSVMLDNSPEGRRQRMLARLQKKHREKNSR